MTRFLDVRVLPIGGNLAASVAINQGTSMNDYKSLSRTQFLNDIRGRNVLIGTHGFNVDRGGGITSLANWESLLQAPEPFVFVGLLWPGDSIWAHGLDYPEEPRIANEAGRLIAPFVDNTFPGAASVSFASHSLGARLVLEAVSQMHLAVRRVILMAAAIDDNCLSTEFKAAAARIGQISVLASNRDEVLSAAFPLGNFFAGIIAEGHPWWHAALGHRGPSHPRPTNFQSPFEIPDNWNFGHSDYLRIDPPPAPEIPLPAIVPPNGDPLPAEDAPGWHEAWAAALSSTRLR